MRKENKPDLDASSTVLHQKFFETNDLEILRRTHGRSYLYTWITESQQFNVSATGPQDTSRVQLRLKGVLDANRFERFDMKLFHTGDGTNVRQVYSKYASCEGPSCGLNGLSSSSTSGPKLIFQELYINGWLPTDNVRLITNYLVESHICSCRRVGMYNFHTQRAS